MGTAADHEGRLELGDFVGLDRGINVALHTGREWDPEILAYAYRARYYVPGIGRFASQDPIGYLVSNNLYEYVAGNPIINRDPTGLAPNWVPWWAWPGNWDMPDWAKKWGGRAAAAGAAYSGYKFCKTWMDAGDCTKWAAEQCNIPPNWVTGPFGTPWDASGQQRQRCITDKYNCCIERAFKSSLNSMPGLYRAFQTFDVPTCE
jgi:RHS repeat-associated protein